MRVNDLKSLNDLFKKIKSEKDKIEENTQFFKDELSDLQMWLESSNKPHEANIEYYNSLAVDFLARLREETGEKSVSVPYGVVKSRVSRQAVQQGDKDKLFEYVKENEIKEAIKESLNWSELKKRLEIAGGKVIDTKTGEVVDGAHIKPETVSYSVEVKK